MDQKTLALIAAVATLVMSACQSSTMLAPTSTSQTSVDYHAAFHRAVQAHYADAAQLHDPHGLKTLGVMREQIIAEFGKAQYDEWLNHAITEVCLVKTENGWAGAYVLQPDLPALPSCGVEPNAHFTAELILGMVWNDLTEFRRPGWQEELVIPRADLVYWLQRHIAIDDWSPGMETQALIAGGVPLTETWQTVDGRTWSIPTLLDAVIVRWRENRDKAALQQGDIVPENMLHFAPALIELLEQYPGTLSTYRPLLDEVFATYKSTLHPDGYWGFPGETFSTGHIVEQYIMAQRAGVSIELPSLHPVELMVKYQRQDGWFDIHDNPFIGSQSHGVRALGLTLPLLIQSP